MTSKIKFAKYLKLLPRPVNVLVRRVGGHSDYAYSAMCMQYPVEGRAADPKSATINLLFNLSGYLIDCERFDAKAFATAPDHDQELFGHADQLKLENKDLPVDIDVRIRFVGENWEEPGAQELSKRSSKRKLDDVVVDVRGELKPAGV